MANGMIPPGYNAVLVGTATTFEELSSITPLEENADEGTLVLVRLNFAEPPSSEQLAMLEQSFTEAGVTKWPDNSSVVYLNTENSSSIFLAWQKGLAWMPVIIGILVVALLPVLLGALVWWLLPQDIKDMINAMVTMGIVVIMMLVMSKIMPGKEPKKKIVSGET